MAGVEPTSTSQVHRQDAESGVRNAMPCHQGKAVAKAGRREFSDVAMLCEKCQEREAMVHITLIRPESAQHHFCDACAQSSPLANPKLGYGPDAIEEQLRVVRVMEDSIVVRLVRTESLSQPTE